MVDYGWVMNPNRPVPLLEYVVNVVHVDGGDAPEMFVIHPLERSQAAIYVIAA
jgi:hypothetical protein